MTKIIPLKCPICGANVSRETLTCKYCGTSIIISEELRKSFEKEGYEKRLKELREAERKYNQLFLSREEAELLQFKWRNERKVEEVLPKVISKLFENLGLLRKYCATFEEVQKIKETQKISARTLANLARNDFFHTHYEEFGLNKEEAIILDTYLTVLRALNTLGELREISPFIEE